jgi:hypothetical protein
MVVLSMNVDFWLSEGPQTEITDLVRYHAQQPASLNIPQNAIDELTRIALENSYDAAILIATVKNIAYVHTLPSIDGSIEELLRKRTAHHILEQGSSANLCSDIGTIIRNLNIAQGIPTSMIQAVHEIYLTDPKHKSTHVFLRIFGNTSFVIDPVTGELYSNENKIPNYVVLNEGRDSWDMGYRNKNDQTRAIEQNLDLLRERYQAKNHSR